MSKPFTPRKILFYSDDDWPTRASAGRVKRWWQQDDRINRAVRKAWEKRRKRAARQDRKAARTTENRGK